MSRISNPLTVAIQAASSTAMGTLAASMSAGSWAELTGITGQNASLGVGLTSGSMIHYCNQMPWNPVRKTIDIIAMDHASNALRYVRYDAASNAFVTVSADLGVGTGTRHGYGHNTVNPTTGDHYYRLSEFNYEGSGLLVYKCAYPGNSIAALARATTLFYMQNAIGSCWWSGSFSGGGAQGSLILWNCGDSNLPPGSANDGGIYAYNPLTDTWFYSARSATPFYGANSGDTYHGVMAYSPSRNVAVMGGGNARPDKIWRLNSDRSTTVLTDPPSGCTIGIQQGIVCEEPVTGDFLCLSNGGLWSLDPTGSGTWTARTGGRTPPSGFNPTGGTNGVTCTPIPEYGVVAYIQQTGSSGGTTYLYKHA